MKKLQFVLIILATSLLFTSCDKTKGVAKPDDMGKYVFDFLKGIDDVTKDGYINYLMTVEEIKAFGKRNAETLTPKAKDDIDDLEKDKYEGKMSRDYNRLKERGKKYKIDWNTIEYGDYEFEERDEDGLKGARGTLSFAYEDKDYAVRITSVSIDGTYKLVRIANLREKRE
ncbi:hypothetical protein [Kordia sp.]|uniref:hypothetical protein n=1 Tax=Kordia sp. TaxID=1965332 RepID=UPI003D6AE454